MKKTQAKQLTPQELKVKFSLPSLKAANYCIHKSSGLSGVKSAIKSKYSVKTAYKASLDLSKKRSVIRAIAFLTKNPSSKKPKVDDKDPKVDLRVGSNFWEARSTHGRKPIFETPEQLWDACLQYFQWNLDNPIITKEVVKYQGEATLADVPKMRAMTTSGLCIYLGIGTSTWNDYSKRNDKTKDYSVVTTRAEEIIYNQKFSGAAAEQLNPNIIARDLGLVDKQDVTAKVKANVTNNITFEGVSDKKDK